MWDDYLFQIKSIAICLTNSNFALNGKWLSKRKVKIMLTLYSTCRSLFASGDLNMMHYGKRVLIGQFTFVSTSHKVWNMQLVWDDYLFQIKSRAIGLTKSNFVLNIERLSKRKMKKVLTLYSTCWSLFASDDLDMMHYGKRVLNGQLTFVSTSHKVWNTQLVWDDYLFQIMFIKTFASRSPISLQSWVEWGIENSFHLWWHDDEQIDFTWTTRISFYNP